MDALVDDEMFDIMNMLPEETGVAGTIYVSTRQGAHGPRIKWFPGKPADDAPILVVTIEEDPRIINHGVPARVARRGGAAVRDWVMLNREDLLNLWNNGRFWSQKDFMAFFATLKKLP